MTACPSPILVIKLGALGDFVQALGPFAAIRRHHAGEAITLLTSRPFAQFASASGYFDQVWEDPRPAVFEIGKWFALRRRLRNGGFARVYDLQTSDRSSFYYRLFAPKPEWSGIARGCSHPHANPQRDFMHTIERQDEQLKMAGIKDVPLPDLSWAEADAGRFGLAAPHALLAPGGAAHRPAKRWPAENYGKLAARLAGAGIEPVLIGGREETELLDEILALSPGARNLAGLTSLVDVAVLARDAVCAAGNDTGPMHLTAVAGCKTVVLYSAESDPALCAQRGPGVEIIRRDSLNDLSVDEVWAALGA